MSRHSHDIGLSRVVASELACGVATRVQHATAMRSNGCWRCSRRLPMTNAVYGQTANCELRATLEPRGPPIATMDTRIAAYALAVGAPPVTNNDPEFSKVPGPAMKIGPHGGKVAKRRGATGGARSRPSAMPGCHVLDTHAHDARSGTRPERTSGHDPTFRAVLLRAVRSRRQIRALDQSQQCYRRAWKLSSAAWMMRERPPLGSMSAR